MNNEETETIVEQENQDSIIISTQEMIRDARERRGKKLTEFQCKTCDYKSPSITLLEKHEKAYHKVTVVHNCEECGKIFTRTADLNQHKVSCHEKKQYPCNKCDYKSPSTTLLDEHEKSYHHVTVVHNCDECNKIFSGIDDLNQHKVSCHDNKQYPCNQCDFKATTKQKVRLHIDIEHTIKAKNKSQYVPKRIKCEECEKKFNKKETFEKHKCQQKIQHTIQPDNMTLQRYLRSNKITK